jgi:hydroxymethylbilane synthase
MPYSIAGIAMTKSELTKSKQPKTTLRLATRKSRLARWQSEQVKYRLETRFPELHIELVAKKTSGDRHTDQPLQNIGGKSLFVKELQHLILSGEADFAVHSVKDLSCQEHNELGLAAILERADARDAFLSTRYSHWSELPLGARIGTASPRRACQLRHWRSDLNCVLLRGNVDTRVEKLETGEYDAIVLAAAGLSRLGLSNKITAYFEPDIMLPAIGQGAIGIECRKDNKALLAILHSLNHEETAVCIQAERAVNAHLGGDCFTPIAAYATLTNNQIYLSGLIGNEKTLEILRASACGSKDSPVALGQKLADDLLAQGAEQFLCADH